MNHIQSNLEDDILKYWHLSPVRLLQWRQYLSDIKTNWILPLYIEFNRDRNIVWENCEKV